MWIVTLVYVSAVQTNDWKQVLEKADVATVVGPCERAVAVCNAFECVTSADDFDACHVCHSETRQDHDPTPQKPGAEGALLRNRHSRSRAVHERSPEFEKT